MCELSVASEFMYDNCRVNIGYEYGDKRILEYNTQKIFSLLFRILYLNLLRLNAASKIVDLQFRNS